MSKTNLKDFRNIISYFSMTVQFERHKLSPQNFKEIIYPKSFLVDTHQQALDQFNIFLLTVKCLMTLMLDIHHQISHDLDM